MVGFSTAAGGVGIVREILRAFAERAPDVDLRTQEHDFSDPSAGLADGSADVAFVFGPLPADGLSSITLVKEPRLLALRPEHPLAARAAVTSGDLRDLPWLQVPAPPGPWPDFWFPRAGRGAHGPLIRTADEWVAAIEAGRGTAFTMPTVMRSFTTARVALVPVADLPSASVLLAWETTNPDPLARAFVANARDVVAGSRGG